MGFNSAFKGLKLLKKPGNGRLNNLNDPFLNVLKKASSVNDYHELQSDPRDPAIRAASKEYISHSEDVGWEFTGNGLGTIK